MIRPVLKMGNPLLFQKSELILQDEFNSSSLNQLIIDMQDTMREYGGVGIAAPQIGVSKRIFIIECDETNQRYSKTGGKGLTSVINPQIKFIGSEKIFYNEGCLSLPYLRGEVWRKKSIGYTYYDQFGAIHEGQDDGFFARVIHNMS